MTYYQILRQRRIDLNLSIQDVSSQTRLAPEYIQAIELNNLEVFSDDFSFVRYFVRAYCDAIGVNWQAISAQVDANIRAYAHQRNMALTQAQQKMVNTMPSAQGQRTKRSSKNKLQKRVTKISRNLNWSRQKLMRTLVIFGVGVFVILFVVNLGLDYMAEQRAYQARLEKENLLEKKEQETERLAKQRQKEAQKEQIVVENTGVNTYTISNVLEHSTPLNLEITLPLDTTVVVYNNGTIISGDENTVYTDIFKKEILVDTDSLIEIHLGAYSGNQFSINGNKIAFDETYWYPGQAAVMDVYVKSNKTLEEEKAQAEQEAQEALEYQEEYSVYE